jgi:multimeric flavodoxin WrbA
MTEISTLKNYLKTKQRVLFLTTSNRWSEHGEIPKTTQLAYDIAHELKDVDIKVIDVSKLNIHVCEGNVSSVKGNKCGVKDAILNSKEKNPSGFHRCWASVNNEDDELWKISKEIFQSEAVVFFVSTRWGQTNSIYQKLIERLTWIENRWTTLKEENVIKDIEAGIVVVGQQWNTQEVMQTQVNVLTMFGFKTPVELSLNWQYTEDLNDESQESYQKAPYVFQDDFRMLLKGLKKSKENLGKYVNRYTDFFPK